jgi:hypothetical protein
MTDLKLCGKKWSSILRYYLGIYQEELMKTTKIIVRMVCLHAELKPRTTQIRSRNVAH